MRSSGIVNHSRLLAGILLVAFTVVAVRVTGARAFSGDTVADRELGQFDMFHNGANTVDLDVMNQPNQIALDRSIVPNRLYVADSQNSRILGYHSVAALVTGTPADIVIGQRDFYSTGCNNPVLSFSSLCNASGVAVDSAGNLWVADYNNHRVLEFPDPFTTMKNTGMTAGFIATVVVGQGGNFRSNACNLGGSPTSGNLCNPVGVALDGSKNLFVTDYGNNRVLEYNTPVTSSSVAARVFGQLGNFKSSTANNGGVTATSLSSPKGIAVDLVSNALYVADNGNSRVLKFSTPLTSQTASLVFGQAGLFNQNNCNTGGTITANTLCGNFFTSLGVTVDASENVYIADFGNNRVLEFIPPIAANPKANAVFGQSDLMSNACNLPGPPSAKTMCSPISAVVDSAKNLWVSDLGNNRVVGIAFPFSAPPTSAAVVLGQPDAVHNAANSVDPYGLWNPAGIAIDSNKHLFVADYSNSRVLGYSNATLFANNAPASLVIGQPDLYSSGCNQNNAPEGANTLCNPQGVAVDKSGNLYVADYNNSRVLIYTPPFSSGHVVNQSASVVLGQSTFSTHNNVTSINGLSNPTGVALDGSGRLYVVDRFNNRVVQFLPTFTNGKNASIVIGQPNFTSGNCNQNVAANKSTLCNPIGAALDSVGNLYVADEFNSRVLEYKAPLVSAQGANLVFGQLGSFTTTGCNGIPTGLNADSLCGPQGVTLDGANNLYIADSFADQGHNNRVLKYYTPLLKTAKPGSGDTTADRVFGQADNFTSNQCNFGGSAPSARSLCNPYGIALDSLGNVYVSDFFNNRVLEYDVP